MSTITLLCTQNQIDKIHSTFHDSLSDKTPAYAQFQCKLEGCVITAYQSKKVVFQGTDAEIFASAFMNTDKSTIQAHAGSDEVGTGDYFGPICVCACIVPEHAVSAIQAYGIQDSKMMTDDIIVKVAPDIMKLCPHSLLILPNSKYNVVHQHSNMNAIKAKLHNQAYINLSKKQSLPELVVVDQFAPEDLYYRYLSKEKTIIRNIHFETKAENKYLAVACASVIARYAFLESLKNYESHYKMTFLKGASDAVDRNAAEFVKKFGEQELHNVAKVHFKNTEKLREYL